MSDDDPQCPHGHLNAEDGGEVAVRIGLASDKPGVVVVGFPKAVRWFGLPPRQAREFAAEIFHWAILAEAEERASQARATQVEEGRLPPVQAAQAPAGEERSEAAADPGEEGDAGPPLGWRDRVLAAVDERDREATTFKFRMRTMSTGEGLVEVRLFVGPAQGTLQSAGTLRLDDEEWGLFEAALFDLAVERPVRGMRVEVEVVS